MTNETEESNTNPDSENQDTNGSNQSDQGTDFLENYFQGMDRFDKDLYIVTFGVGAYTGFCNAQNIQPNNHLITYGMLIAPTLANGLVGFFQGAKKGLLPGSTAGTALGLLREGLRRGMNTNRQSEGGTLENLLKGSLGGALTGTALGVSLYGIAGGTKGIIHGGAISMMGYWAGYTAGQTMNYMGINL